MKRISSFSVFSLVSTTVLMAVAMSAIAGAQSQSQTSLGDYARAVKKTESAKAPAKIVYTNDNLPDGGSLSVVGKPADASANQDKDADAAKDAQAADKASDADKDKDKEKDKAELKPGQTDAERDKALAALKGKLDEQKSKVDLLTRELAVLQGEYKLKATAFVNNPQQRVQNPGGFDAEAAKYTQQIADKQKDLDAAKAALTAMQDNARKSGAPNSAVE
jgi:hypothetical protein